MTRLISIKRSVSAELRLPRVSFVIAELVFHVMKLVFHMNEVMSSVLMVLLLHSHLSFNQNRELMRKLICDVGLHLFLFTSS